MGSICCSDTRAPTRTVTYLANSLPKDDPKYNLITNNSVRFSEVTVSKEERNYYMFSMCIKDEVDIHAKIPVLNQIVHCITCQNFELEFGSRGIIDIFCQEYTSTMLQAKNPKTGMEFTVKIVPFKSYTSIEFKKAFYQLWINQKIGTTSDQIVKLLDYFIYGLNPDMQAFVFLFQRCPTSLANVAQYRKQANMPWNEKEKIKIFTQILESYETLFDKNIVHRDLRPSNIFYCNSTGRFSIGNFSKSRLMRRNQQQDLMTVCGVPDYSCNSMEILMGNGQSIGFYEGLEQDYYGLKAIAKLIDTCELLDKNPQNQSPEVQKIMKQFTNNVPFKIILSDFNKVGAKNSVEAQVQIGDRNVAKSCSYLLAHTHKDQIQKWTFDTYGLLGYHREYSNKAHKILDYNNQNQKELLNAPILKKLGQFYENKGSKGTEYFYNAFVLYIRRCEREVKNEQYEKAEQELDCARQTYLRFNRELQSQLPRIQINRMTAILESRNHRDKEAINIINQTFVKAAQQNIPVEKQCKILLAFGQIHKYKPENRNQALKKLITGLTICENGTSFESPSSCRIFKSHFLFQIGSLYLNQMLSKFNPKHHSDEQLYGNDLKAKAQVNLISALQIRQKQAVEEIDVAIVLQQLGTLYYHDEKFYDARKYYERALIRYNHLKNEINPLKLVNVLYMKGSSYYYLNQFENAAREYESALKILQKQEKKKNVVLLALNIEGNLCLAMIQMRRPEGKTRFETVLDNIKRSQGERSYDYACLKMAYGKILRRA